MRKLYTTIIVCAFALLAVVFDVLPRSTVSALEKRELKTFPQFSVDSLLSGTFTSEVSAWFSDSEPFRDELMTLSMQVKHLARITTSDDNITFHASTDADPEMTPDDDDADVDGLAAAAAEAVGIEEYENRLTADENAKIANAGIIIVGTGDNVRALMAYGGSAKGCTGYAEAANKYKETFPDVNVYCMVIPTAVEYYCPDKARKATRRELPTIENVHSHLRPDVKPVNVYSVLGEHADEDIFLRTDHHWAPLGAFYAAEEFARVAGVPFRQLDSYERRVVHGYVGSMYGYSQDIAIKQAPEDFVYYMPRGVDYTTYYTNYTIDKNYHVTSMGRPFKSRFFFHYKDGNGGAYCTFMGGDTKITRVETSTRNGRRVLILKDSFGNALPGYLFYSFEEVHVVDSRYFTKNMQEYVSENHITDILFANNIFKAYSKHTYGNYLRFLSQDGTIRRPTPTKSTCNDSINRESSPSMPTTPSGTASPTSTASSRDSINS